MDFIPIISAKCVLFSGRSGVIWFGESGPGVLVGNITQKKIGREYPPVIKGQHMLKSINSLHLRRSRITITASMFNVDEEPHKDILSPHSVLFDRLSRFTE